VTTVQQSLQSVFGLAIALEGLGDEGVEFLRRLLHLLQGVGDGLEFI
jgi:hypothetical protein